MDVNFPEDSLYLLSDETTVISYKGWMRMDPAEMELRNIRDLPPKCKIV